MSIKKTLAPHSKRRLLTDIIQWQVGYEVDYFVGRILSSYNWDTVQKLHAILKSASENGKDISWWDAIASINK